MVPVSDTFIVSDSPNIPEHDIGNDDGLDVVLLGSRVSVRKHLLVASVVVLYSID